MMIPELTIKLNGVAIPLTPSMIQLNNDPIEDEGDGIPEDIMAIIDGKSDGEFSGKSPMHTPKCDDMNHHDEEDNEDAPEWEFSPDEAISKLLDYLFCPHPHHCQILCLFT